MHLNSMLSKLIGKATLKNAGWIIGERIIHMMIAFFVNIWTARYLGPSNYGIINYVGAYITFFASVCTLGIDAFVIKEIVEKPEEQGTVTGTALGLQGLACLFSAFMVVGLVWVIDGDQLIVRVAAISSMGLMFQAAKALKDWYQAHLLSKYTTIASLIAFSLVSFCRVILLARGMSIEWFAFVAAMDHVVVAICYFVFYSRLKGPSMLFSWGTGKRLLQKGLPYVISGIMGAVYASTDKLMLKQMINEASVGHYAVAITISNLWVFLLGAIIDSLKPVIMKKNNVDRSEYERLNKFLYAIVFYLSVLVSVFFCVFGKYIVLLLYGVSYSPAIEPLRVITWYVAFSYLGVARDIWVVCENKQNYLVFLYACAALTNVVLNVIFIPVMGTVGAAIASLFTQISTIMVFPMAIKGLRPNTKLILDAIMLKGILWNRTNTEEK